jgi:hypothetical protein
MLHNFITELRHALHQRIAVADILVGLEDDYLTSAAAVAEHGAVIHQRLP